MTGAIVAAGAFLHAAALWRGDREPILTPYLVAGRHSCENHYNV